MQYEHVKSLFQVEYKTALHEARRRARRVLEEANAAYDLRMVQEETERIQHLDAALQGAWRMEPQRSWQARSELASLRKTTAGPGARQALADMSHAIRIAEHQTSIAQEELCSTKTSTPHIAS